jgi:hypothetical protein
MTPDDFVACVLENPVNAALLSVLPGLGLDQCYLTAGCLFQAIWNLRSGRGAGWGVRDYDVFYFDPDLSWEAEDAVIRQVALATDGLGIDVQVRNQARVHLWYERHFGVSSPALMSTRQGIDRFLIECTCVGIEASSGRLYAPNGLEDLRNGILRMNSVNPQPALFRRKAADYRARWGWLSVAV